MRFGMVIVAALAALATGASTSAAALRQVGTFGAPVSPDRTTGAVRRLRGSEPLRDIDSKTLARGTGCAPATSPEWGDGRFRVRFGGPRHRALYLERCSTHALRLLSRCRSFCSS